MNQPTQSESENGEGIEAVPAAKASAETMPIPKAPIKVASAPTLFGTNETSPRARMMVDLSVNDALPMITEIVVATAMNDCSA